MKASILPVLAAVVLMTACDQTEEVILPVNGANQTGTNQPINSESSLAQAQEIGNALVTGLWEVILLIDDGENETAEVANFHFSFNVDGSVIAISTVDSTQTFEGMYSVFFDDGQSELSMSFPNVGALDDLNDDWYFVEGTTSLLVFEDLSDNLPDALTLQQVGSGEGNPIDNDPNPNPNTDEDLAIVLAELLNNNWVVTMLVDDDEDETNALNGYIFTFSNANTVTVTRDDDPNFLVSGSFNLFTDDNRIELAMNFSGNADLENLNDDWYYITSTSETLVFEDDQSEQLNALTLTKL